MFGLGLVETDEPAETEAAVAAAIETGIRLIDTASVYRNEREVGNAVRNSPVSRSDLFVTTKVWNSDLGYDATLRAFDRSLEALGLDYLDMYMIHWPLIRLRREAWRALGRITADGRCRTIGVCNFTSRHLEEIIGETGTVPAVNQVEINPFIQQAKLHDWCRRREILVQTHTPVSHLTRRKGRVVHDMAERYGRTANQILLRWGLQRDLSVLLRTLDPSSIAQARGVFDFELGLPDMDTLNSMNANLRTGWDPTKSP
jgi:diketogulonate reductase-like aldo/keto reductase